MDFINTFHFIYPDLKNTYTDQAFTYLTRTFPSKDGKFMFLLLILIIF